MKTILKLLLAIILSSLSVIPLFLVIIVLSGDVSNQLLIVALATAVIITFIAVTFLGVPVHLLLCSKGWTRWYCYFISGFAGAGLVLYLLGFFRGEALGILLLQVLIFGVTGGLIALIFRKLAL